MVYKWKTFDYSVPAQDVGEHLEELDRIYGEITPQMMVDDARPDGALMHPLYEWRDEVAAEKYRCSQAKAITSNLVRVKVSESEPQKTETIRAFVSVKPHNEQAKYRPIQIAMSEPNMREIVLENARAELDAMRRKYEALCNYFNFTDFLTEYLSKAEAKTVKTTLSEKIVPDEESDVMAGAFQTEERTYAAAAEQMKGRNI